MLLYNFLNTHLLAKLLRFCCGVTGTSLWDDIRMIVINDEIAAEPRIDDFFCVERIRNASAVQRSFCCRPMKAGIRIMVRMETNRMAWADAKMDR